MLTTFLMTLEQMIRIFLLLAIGFIFNKLHVVPKAAEGVLSRFSTTLFLPCLILYSSIMECSISSLVENSGLVLLGTVFCLASMAISFPGAKLLAPDDAYQRGVCRYALSFPNTGAFGMPLVLAFFGTSGLFLFNLFYFIPCMLCYTWGIIQLQPSKGETSFRDTMRKILNPTTIASLLGIVLGVIGSKNWLPPIIVKTTGDLGNCYVIAGLLVTGYSIADYPLGQVFGNLRIWIFTLARLVLIPAVFCGVLILCGAPLMTCIVAVLAYAGPCGMNPAIYAAAYGEDCSLGVGMILISSLCSVITIPVMYALVQYFAA